MIRSKNQPSMERDLGECTQSALDVGPAIREGLTWLHSWCSTWDKLIEKVTEFGEIAEELEASSAQLALAWCLKNPTVSSVILGATNVAQLHENLGALELLPRLSPEILERIDKLMGNAPVSTNVDFVARELTKAKMSLG
mmetsp:Transcript_15844/g.46950  ORF Transcript_15844/g.46950 Transcript_15844/m.46950 type:complete len:140 (+) Transcript_15844:1101-1520(+)